MNAQIIHGDCIEVMRGMAGDSVDSIVTDPPYGLGFMGKKWDALPPGEEWARECLRVLKPGGHLLAFGGTRTWHRLAVAVEDAGFEMRDSIAWLYGEGFPKHRATLKPAFEPVVMARKPFKGSLTANEETHGTGALDIDGCRIPMNAKDAQAIANMSGFGRPGWTTEADYNTMTSVRTGATVHNGGRWPANVTLDEAVAELLDEWTANMRAAKTSGAHVRRSSASRPDTIYGDYGPHEGGGFGDDGGASRFFYVAKAPKKERPVVDGMAHPTVKPLTLMRWLVRLVTPSGGTVLDPFAGSGTTIEAALLEGFNPVGIEREAEYLPLIQARIERTAA